MKLFYLISVILLFCRPNYSIAQNQIVCDETLTPSSDQEFAYKKRGIRCEGFYRSKVSSTSLEIIGLLSGKLNYNLVENEMVEINAAIIIDKEIHIRAQAFPLKTYYRMDGVIEKSQILEWPIRDIILPRKLASKKIGLLGWYIDFEPIYIPLKANAKICQVLNDDKIRASFRANVDVQVYYKLYSYNDKKWTDWKRIERIYRSGSPIVITLPTIKNGFYKLYVSAKVLHSDDEWLEKSIHLYLGK